MRTLSASDFKARCLRVMDEVQTRREPVLITKKGRPVARLVPVDDAPRKVLGCLRGILEITGDSLAPVVPASDWKHG